MKPYKFYDCSINSVSNKTHNKDSLGPVQNDIMKDLNQYSNLFGFRRTYNHEEADIFITNTTYPYKILDWSKKHSIPKIKRMDGIYWQNNLIHKNQKLNDAALMSDHVIFISEYSKKTLKTLYGISLYNSSVILNNADDTVFFPREKPDFRLVSSCSNWEREGKRLEYLIELANNIDDEIHLIGKCDIDLPDNMVKHGYIDSQQKMSTIIDESHIFISLFYRDAGSKVTCQAVKCHVPVLYVTSGGLNELVRGNGVSITDDTSMTFRNDIPTLNIEEMLKNYKELKYSYNDIINKYKKREPYYRTMENYFNIMKNYI